MASKYAEFRFGWPVVFASAIGIAAKAPNQQNMAVTLVTPLSAYRPVWRVRIAPIPTRESQGSMQTIPNADRKNAISTKCMSADRWRTAAEDATNMIPAAIIQSAPRIEPGRAVNRARSERIKA